MGLSPGEIADGGRKVKAAVPVVVGEISGHGKR
jgi:hypothetical protein